MLLAFLLALTVFFFLLSRTGDTSEKLWIALLILSMLPIFFA